MHANDTGGDRSGLSSRRRWFRLALGGAGLLAALLGPATTAAHATAAAGTLQVSPATVAGGGPVTLIFTFQADPAVEVKGPVMLTVPNGWTGTLSADPAACAAAHCEFGTPAVDGDTITMPGSYLPPGQSVSIIYRAAATPSVPGTATFILTADASPVAIPVAVTCPDGAGAMSVSPGTVTTSSTATLTFTYTAAGCGLRPGGEVTMEVPAAWAPPGQAVVSPQVSIAVTVSGRQITLTNTGHTVPAGGQLTLSYSTPVPASAQTAVFPVAEAAAKGGIPAPLAASPQIMVSAPAPASSSPATGQHGGGATGSPGQPTITASPPTTGASHPIRARTAADASPTGIWQPVILLSAALFAAAVGGIAAALRRPRRAGRHSRRAAVQAVPHPGPPRAPSIARRGDQAALTVRVEPHPGAAATATKQVTQ